MFDLMPLPEWTGGGLWYRDDEGTSIILDPSLSQVERNAALAHELIHDERGGVIDHPDAPDAWAAVVTKEERTVDRIRAERLVPLVELAQFAGRLADLEGGVTALDVAEEFGVPEDVARVALELLVDDHGGAA